MRPDIRSIRLKKTIWLWISTGLTTVLVVLYVLGRLTDAGAGLGLGGSVAVLAIFGCLWIVVRFARNRFEHHEYEEVNVGEQTIKDNISSIMSRLGHPATTREIASGVEQTAFTTGRLLTQMEREGIVVREGGKYRLSGTATRGSSPVQDDR